MPLATRGNVQGCPCCGLNLPHTFMSVTLLEVEPPLAGSLASSRTRTEARGRRVCIRCSYVLDLPPEHANNLYAREVADRLSRRGPFPAPPPALHVDADHGDAESVEVPDAGKVPDPAIMEYRDLQHFAKAIGVQGVGSKADLLASVRARLDQTGGIPVYAEQ